MTMVAFVGKMASRPPTPMASIVRAIMGNGAGVIAAQLISFASMTVVTRLYSPSDVGYLGLFMSLVAVLTPLGTLSYPNAICYAHSHGHAIAVAGLGLMGALALSLLIGLLGIATSFLHTDALVQCALLGIGIFASALATIITQTTFRARLIRVRAKVLVLAAAAVAAGRIIAGWYSPSALGLVGTAIFGYLLTSCLLLLFGLRVSWPKLAKAMARAPLRRCARLYDAFPRYTMPVSLVRYAMVSTPTLAFGIVEGSALAGQYTLAAAVVSAPLLMVADAVGDAITRPLAQRAEQDSRGALRLALRLSGVLTLLVTPALLLFLLVPHWAMGTAFGPGWNLSGDFVRLLVLWMAGMLVVRPLACLVPVLGMQKQLLHNELGFSVLRLAGFFTGLLVLGSAELAVAGFVLPGLIQSSITGLWVVQVVRRGGTNQTCAVC